MKICCIRNVAFEGPGIIGDWTKSSGHSFMTVKAYEGEAIPKTSQIDALVIMGGPMGANDDIKYPWLTDVKELIHKTVMEEKPVLGICLGSQLLANVLGSPVYRNKEKEIGWFPVELTEDGKTCSLTAHLPYAFNTFHWHGDTYDLPEGAIHLMRSAGCKHQAFLYNKALGLQFHMEMKEENIEEVAERCAHEFTEAPFIQEREAIYNHPDIAFNHSALGHILNAWICL